MNNHWNILPKQAKCDL